MAKKAISPNIKLITNKMMSKEYKKAGHMMNENHNLKMTAMR